MQSFNAYSKFEYAWSNAVHTSAVQVTFKEILTHYRTQPQASSATFRTVPLLQDTGALPAPQTLNPAGSVAHPPVAPHGMCVAAAALRSLLVASHLPVRD